MAPKYGQEATFHVWVEYIKERGERNQDFEERWHPDLSFAQALDILDEHSSSIERFKNAWKRKEEERKREE